MRFLIVKTSSLGDIIHAFKALAYLRYKCPYAQIDWVVERPFKLLVERHPMVDQVHCIETRKWRKTWWRKSGFSLPDYDIVFDLQGNIKSAWVLSKVRAKQKIGFGKKSLPEWPNMFFTTLRVNPAAGQNIRDDYLDLIRAFFQDKEPFEETPFLYQLEEAEENMIQKVEKGGVLVCPSAAWVNKQLPDQRLLIELKKLEGPFYFIWGNEDEKKRVIKLAAKIGDATVLPKLNLPTLQRLMERCRLVLAMDSLPLHLCATTPTPSLSFFGPSSAQKYAPQGSRHTSVQGSCPFDVTFEKRCPMLRTCHSAACISALKSK